MQELRKQLDDSCNDFGQAGTDIFYDQLSMCDEAMMDAYLETGRIEDAQIKMAVANRCVFPCYFGSALKLTGVEQLMQGIAQ